jgi:hypothetical protein
MIVKVADDKVCEATIVAVLVAERPGADCNASTINKPLLKLEAAELTRLFVEAGAVHAPTTLLLPKILTTYWSAYSVVIAALVMLVAAVAVLVAKPLNILAPR